MKNRFYTSQTSPNSNEEQQTHKSVYQSKQKHLSPIILETKQITPVSLSARKKAKSKNTAINDYQGFSDTDSYGPSNGSSVYDQQGKNHYHSIAELTTKQNENLKQQNEFLLSKLKKMKEREKKVHEIYKKAQNYKAMYLQSLEQIELLKEECEIYKKQADEMKEIALKGVSELSQKVDLKILQEPQGQHEQHINKNPVPTPTFNNGV